MRLCGIISRFQLLSPGIGQVTHALLTRPPLSYYISTRRSQFNNSVRLACVRHAASVHPEPGSNSQFIIRSGQNHLLTLSVFLLFLSYARLGCMKAGCSELFSADLICFLEFFRVALLFICQGALPWFSVFSWSSVSWRLLSRNVLYFITCGSLCQELFYFSCSLFSGQIVL